MIDFKRMLGDLQIPYKEQGKDWQPGWIQITCPCCDDHEMHGGFNLNKGYYNCWRCGKHEITKIISLLLGINESKTWKIIKPYKTSFILNQPERKKSKALEIKYPDGTGEINKIHKDYLKNRNFKWKTIKDIWKIKGTNHLGDYKFRIIAPIFFKNRLVSYQGRDITDKSNMRYKACRIDLEILHHKHTLYGIDLLKKRRCVVVEGITDVWRLGPGSVSTFGTSFKLEQALMLKEYVDYCAILFDNSAAAQEKADKLNSTLQSLGVQVENFELEDYEDPAELPQKVADEFMASIIY